MYRRPSLLNFFFLLFIIAKIPQTALYRLYLYSMAGLEAEVESEPVLNFISPVRVNCFS